MSCPCLYLLLVYLCCSRFSRQSCRFCNQLVKSFSGQLILSILLGTAFLSFLNSLCRCAASLGLYLSRSCISVLMRCLQSCSFLMSFSLCTQLFWTAKLALSATSLGQKRWLLRKEGLTQSLLGLPSLQGLWKVVCFSFLLSYSLMQTPLRAGERDCSRQLGEWLILIVIIIGSNQCPNRQSLNVALLVLLHLLRDHRVHIAGEIGEQLLVVRVLLERKPGLEVEPVGKRHPDLVVLLRCLLHVAQDLVGRPDGLLEVGEAAGPLGLPGCDFCEGVLGLHGLLDGEEVLLVLEVGLLDLVELLLAGLVGGEGLLVEEVAAVGALLEHLQRHLEVGVLELDEEVHEDLVGVLGDGELLPDLPELLGHPAGDAGHVLQVVHELPDVRHFGREDAGEPHLAPRGPLLVLVDEAEADEFEQRGVGCGVELDEPALGALLDVEERVVRLGVEEGMVAEGEQVGDAARRPDVALEAVLLVAQLLWRHVEEGALVEREVVHLGHVHLADRLGAPEVADLDHSAGAQQDVLGLEVPVDHALDGHEDEGVEDLPQDLERLLGAELLFAGEVAHEVALLAVLHHDLQFLCVLVEVIVVDADEVGVLELLHELDLLQGLIDLEGVDVDLLEGVALPALVLRQVHAPETALADGLDHLVGLHGYYIIMQRTKAHQPKRPAAELGYKLLLFK